MIEETIKGFLNKNLSVPAYLEKPSNPPKRYVLFERTGGGKENHIYRPTFAFQSYAESLYQAAKLNDEVKKVVEGMIVLNNISKIKSNSDYNFTDTTTKEYRYQAVFDIIHQ